MRAASARTVAAEDESNMLWCGNIATLTLPKAGKLKDDQLDALMVRIAFKLDQPPFGNQFRTSVPVGSRRRHAALDRQELEQGGCSYAPAEPQIMMGANANRECLIPG